MPNNCSYLISSNNWFISIKILMSIQKGGNNYKLWLSIGEDSVEFTIIFGNMVET